MLESGWYIHGHFLEKFERQFADYQSVNYAIGVGSGLDALKISLASLGIGKGDEVIIPSHTFFATALSVISSGAKPILCDANPDSFNIDPLLAEKLISPKTKAIIPVHLYGNPADMPAIIKMAAGKRIHVIEDNAQSVGTVQNGIKTGSMGIINASSFYPAKNLGAYGDGGIISTNDRNLAEFCRKFRNYGASGKYEFEYAGLNSRLDELQAAFLTVKLKHLEKWLMAKRIIAEKYLNNLSDHQSIKLPQSANANLSTWHIYPILCERRDELLNHLREKGIETLVHYPIPIYRQKVLKDYKIDPMQFPVTETVAAKELSLPIYPGLSDAEVDEISETIIDFYK